MTTMTNEEHDSAVQRLHAKLLEQHRLDERYHDAIGTTTELGAYVRLRAVGDQVAALDAWLHWIDDEAYRGLNAGPFELLAESSDRVPEHRDSSGLRPYAPSGSRGLSTSPTGNG